MRLRRQSALSPRLQFFFLSASAGQGVFSYAIPFQNKIVFDAELPPDEIVARTSKALNVSLIICKSLFFWRDLRDF